MSNEFFSTADIVSIAIYSGWSGLASPPFHGEAFRIDCHDGNWRRQRCDSPNHEEISTEFVAKLVNEVCKTVGWPADRCTLFMTDNYPRIRIEIHFESGELISAFSSSQLAGMVPWTIWQKGTGKVRESGNAALGVSVAAVLPADATNYSRLNSVFGPRSRDDLFKAFQHLTRKESKLGPKDALSTCSMDDMFDKRLLEIGWQESPAKLIETLLDEGIDLNAVSAKGFTALTECIRWKRFEAATALLNFGADPDVPQYQPLAWACDKVKKSCHLKLIEHLLKAGASVEPVLHSFLGETQHPLHDQIRQLLLARQPNIEYTDDNGRTGLHLAAEDEHRSIEPWIRAGANVNAQTTNGKTALMFSQRNATKTRLLLERGADMKLTDSTGRTALHYAVEMSYPCIEVIRILLESGADANVADSAGTTPIQIAANHLRRNAMYRDTREGLYGGLDRASTATYSPRHSVFAGRLMDLAKDLPTSEQLVRLITASQQVDVESHAMLDHIRGIKRF